MTSSEGQWRPTTIRRQESALKTGTMVVKVRTDQGSAFLKAMGNPEGPHVLVCDLVGTRLAAWLGLPTFEFGTIQVIREYGLTFFEDGEVEPGPAFVTKDDPGDVWGGTERQLEQLANPEDLTRLVLFDTWTLNCDRHSPDGKRINRNNVYLSQAAPPGKLLLRAMDHSHCFTCGKPLTPKIGNIDRVKDEGIYGLFPQFRPWLSPVIVVQAVDKLKSFTKEDAQVVTEAIPVEWDVDAATRDALVRFLTTRAAFLSASIMNKLCPKAEGIGRADEEELPR